MVVSPTPPSPGPFLPGAWPPSDSQHRRATTCPTPRPYLVVDPLHLERVLDFQQRLVNQMDKPEIPSATTFAASASADSALAPADSLDSELTRFRSDTSTSMVTDTSVSTAYTSRSSPERLATAKLPQLAFKSRYSALESNYPTRIPRPTGTDISRCVSYQTGPLNLSQRKSVFSKETPSPPRPHSAGASDLGRFPSSSLSLARLSNWSPVSPIVFSSPTSSSFPRLQSKPQSSPHDRSSSYEYGSSPSWETSYGSEYNDQHMLNRSPSSSPSPTSGHENLVPRPSIITTNRTPSIEITPAPMLTSLSLPASPDTSMSLDIEPVYTRSRRLSPVDGDASPWSLSLSPASPVLSAVPDLSLSPVAPDGQRVVSLPSTSSSPAFASSFDSSIPDIDSEVEYVANTSAAAYATAVVSSAWAPEGPSMSQVIPPSLLSVRDEASSNNPSPGAVQLEAALTLEEPGFFGSLENVQRPPIPRQETAKVIGVLERIKKLGDKVKRMLRGKSKRRDCGGVNVDINVRRVGVAGISPPSVALQIPGVIDIQSHTSAAQAYDSLLSSNGTDSHVPLHMPLPPPPGLRAQRPKTRPILFAQTYGSSLVHNRVNRNANGSHPRPVIRVRPPSSSSHGFSSSMNNNSNNANNNAPKTLSPDLIVHSRPKTLAEIKSKRRLSLPTLSTFTRSSSNPSVNVVASNRRARPVSALAFHPQPPPLSRERPTVQPGSHEPPSTSYRPSTSSGAVRSESVPSRLSMAIPRSDQNKTDAMKKKNRHFSLSALSNFAAGHWDEASWQRTGGSSMSSR